jgi:hypothetical protein
VTATALAPHTRNDCETWRQAREGPAGLRRPPYQASTAPEPGDPPSDLDTAEPQWASEGPGWQDVALPFRFLLSRGTSLAIATVVGARGPVVRRPGTVLVLTEAGQTIGVPPGRAAGRGHPGPGRRGTGDRGRTGWSACGSRRTQQPTSACPARSAWTSTRCAWLVTDLRGGPRPRRDPCAGPGRQCGRVPALTQRDAVAIIRNQRGTGTHTL